MSPSKFSVHRPVFTVMVALIVILLGGVSLLRLPIDLMPDVTNPTLSVITSYSNAGPEEVEELITRPIEQAMSAVPGVQEVSSSSSEGSSSVRVSFAWGTDIDAAANDVRDRLDRVAGRLPDGADKPMLRKFDLASFPILILGVSGKLDPPQIRQIIDDQVKNRLERVPGVASLDVWGGMDREIHVNVYPDKAKGLDLSLESLLARIRAQNVNVPAGTIDRGTQEILIRTPGQFIDLDELAETVIATHQGRPVRLKEIASVEDTHPRQRQIVRVNGEPGLRLSISKQSGTNTVQVAKAALEEIERINRDLPQITIVPIVDTSQFIERSISNVGRSAMFGGVLAVLVLLLFLRNVRSTFVIGTAIPISIIATFAVMYFGGFTLNVMTLGGLALGVGMLVDNAIVVLENIYRLRERGMEPQEAAVAGTDEVTGAIIASTLTTLAVFLPLLFVRGMAGVMFMQLAMVVAFSLLCSLGVALTLVPMLAAKLMRYQAGHKRSGPLEWLFNVSGQMLRRMEDGYRSVLHVALSHRLVVVVGCVGLLAAALLLVPLIGSELMPATDEGRVRVSAEMEVGTRSDVLDVRMKQIEQAINDELGGELLSTVTSVGSSGWRGGGGNSGDVNISLVNQAQRSRSSDEIAGTLRRRLSRLPGVEVRTRAAQDMTARMMRLGGGEESVEVEIRGYDLAVADDLASRVKQAMDNVKGISDTRVSRETGSPEETIVVDRRKAADMGLTVEQIARMLETVLAGTQAGSFRQGGDEYPIMVQLAGGDRMELEEILDLRLVNAQGRGVVLRNVVSVQDRRGPVRIDRKDQERVVTVSGNIGEGDLGSVLAEVKAALDAIPKPAGFEVTLGGDYEEQQKAFNELLLSLVLAMVLVYMVMACQYESLRDPFVVMFSVPLAIIGVVLALFVTDTTFNIQTYIGCIMLGGIVVNNAILLVDHTNLLRRRDGMEMREAIEEAGRRRLRPILMTASTTVLGLVPLALGVGEGGEAQAPMARAVIGGLLSSTLITLVFVPVMYSLFERKNVARAGS